MKNARFFNRNPLFRKNTKLQFVPLLPLKEKHRFQKVGKLQNCLSTAHDDHGFSKKKKCHPCDIALQNILQFCKKQLFL